MKMPAPALLIVPSRIFFFSADPSCKFAPILREWIPSIMKVHEAGQVARPWESFRQAMMLATLGKGSAIWRCWSKQQTLSVSIVFFLFFFCVIFIKCISALFDAEVMIYQGQLILTKTSVNTVLANIKQMNHDLSCYEAYQGFYLCTSQVSQLFPLLNVDNPHPRLHSKLTSTPHPQFFKSYKSIRLEWLGFNHSLYTINIDTEETDNKSL